MKHLQIKRLVVESCEFSFICCKLKRKEKVILDNWLRLACGIEVSNFILRKWLCKHCIPSKWRYMQWNYEQRKPYQGLKGANIYIISDSLSRIWLCTFLSQDWSGNVCKSFNQLVKNNKVFLIWAFGLM